MAQNLICDRCGVSFSTEQSMPDYLLYRCKYGSKHIELGGIGYPPAVSVERSKIDLCPYCRDSFLEWMYKGGSK